MAAKYNYEEMKRLILRSESIEACRELGAMPPFYSKPQNAEEASKYMFISYSHRDYKSVYCDLLELHKSGVRYWYDRGLPAGKDWDLEVEKMIKSPDCAGVIFYLSRNLFLSNSVIKEISYTLKGDSDSGGRKEYFTVNLTDKSPSKLCIDTILELGRDADKHGIDSDKLGIFFDAFSDKGTYIVKKNEESVNHIPDVLTQLSERFGVVELTEEEGYIQGNYSGEKLEGKRHGKGVYKWDNGDEYDGDWINNARHGFGTMKYAGGASYSGFWQDDKYHGIGSYTFQSDDPEQRISYEGQFQNGEIQGEGTMLWKGGQKYQGQWLKGVRHGFGTYYYNETGSWEGEWENGNMLNGKGYISYFGEAEYFEFDLFEKAVLKSKLYLGQLVKGKRHGLGVMQYFDGSTYEGSWENGSFGGSGTLNTPFATVQGTWDSGRLNGNAVITMKKNNVKLEGNFQNGQMHGRIVTTLANGKTYEEHFINGKKVVEKNPIDQIFDENDTDPILMYNEKGEGVMFEQIAIIPLNEMIYVILKPFIDLGCTIGANEAFVFQIVEGETEAEDYLDLVFDPEIINAVFGQYNRLLDEAAGGNP